MSSSISRIEINNQEKNEIILENTVRMLTNRGVLAQDKLDDNIEKYKKKLKDDLIFVIKSDTGMPDYVVRFVFVKLTTIRKIPGVDDFFKTYNKMHKLFIVKDVTQKGYKQFLEFPNTEVFWDHELMIDLVSHDIVPEHQPLSSEEKEEYIKAYQTKGIEMPHIFVTDPVSRYYNMKVGDVFRIIRPSITSGHGVSYRLVIAGKLFKK